MDIVNEEDIQHNDNIAVSHTEGLAESLSDVSELKILADVVEAVIGAIFMDSGGSLSTVQRVICHVNIVPSEMLSNSH
jgi:dsRNA-specific ribonuclease